MTTKMGRNPFQSSRTSNQKGREIFPKPEPQTSRRPTNEVRDLGAELAFAGLKILVVLNSVLKKRLRTAGFSFRRR